MSEAVLVGIIASIPGILASGVGIINSLKLIQIHISINSRMDQLLQGAKEVGRAEGVKTEQERNVK